MNDAKELQTKYFDKTMHTLEVLMNQLNMMYYWEKLRLEFADHEAIDLSILEKLMNRCVKMYNLVDSFINIFKLIHKKERLETKGKADETINGRLKVLITLLIKENPILPTQFNFKGLSCWESLW